MSWDEFADLLNGLSEDTPLVRIVQIRTEEDPEVIKNYTAGQRKIRADWHRFKAQQKTETETNEFLKTIEKALGQAFKNDVKGD